MKHILVHSEGQMQMDPYKLTIQREINRWDEGIPLGNGELGALVFGSAKKLTVSLDRGDIWDKSGSPENTPGFCYANLVKWAKSGDRKAIYKTFDLPYQRPTPTKLPCGRLELFVQGDRVPQDCCFALDLKTAACTFTNGGFRLTAFVHAAQGVGMLKTEGAPVKIRLVRPNFGKRTKYSAFFERFSRRAAVSNKLKNVKYPAPVLKQLVRDVRVQLFIQPLNDGSAFGVAVGERQTACGQEFAFYAYSGRGEALENILTEKVTDALRKGYDALFPSHRAWWRAYNARSEICVPDDYIQSRYNMGNYLLGSASRKGNFPMPLQGLWTACDDQYLPPWKGDYHHDLNTELTYLSFLKANRLEQGECFLDYLASLTERGRDFARNFYDADGICLPAVMDIDGYALGGWPMYSLSPTNQLWLCQSFERYYAYTGDVEFLRKTAYPFIEQSARCILSLLQEDAEGFYVLPVSSSPEIHDNTQKSFLTPNSNYDQALLLLGSLLSDFADPAPVHTTLSRSKTVCGSISDFLGTCTFTVLFGISYSVWCENAGFGETGITIIMGCICVLPVVSVRTRPNLLQAAALLLGSAVSYCLVHFASEVITYSANRVIYVLPCWIFAICFAVYLGSLLLRLSARKNKPQNGNG